MGHLRNMQQRETDLPCNGNIARSLQQRDFQPRSNQRIPRRRHSKTRYTLREILRAGDGNRRNKCRPRRHRSDPCCKSLNRQISVNRKHSFAGRGSRGCTCVDVAILIFLGGFGQLKETLAARTRCFAFSLPRRGGTGCGLGR